MAGSVVTGKTQGENCNCPKKCFDKIGEDVGLIFSEFYKLPSKNLQDSYLYGLMKRKHVERTRPRSGSRQPKVSSYVYAVRHNGQEVTVCKKAFQNLHGITKSRLERLQQHLSLGNATPPIDRRGFHQHRANKLPADTITQVREHILSFPRYKSHYSRKDNLQHFYLSPLLSIAKMHELYLEKHEPDQYALLLQNQKIKPIVKYEYFRKYFTENYKINFGKPKSDTCSKCDKLMNKINSADSSEIKRSLEVEKDLHLRKAEWFYKDLKEKTSLAKAKPNVEVITFDFQQNLPLPVSPSGEVFYKIQLWVYNFCIHVGSSGKSYCYVYDETVGGKGQNEVSSMILDFLKTHISPDVTDIYVFSDNCSSQNKNYVLVQLFFTLVELGKFNIICHRYPEPGHSFLPCDRSFGRIEVEKRKYDKIYLPRDYINIIKKSSKNFEVIEVTQDIFVDCKSHLERFYVKNPSKKNHKFTLSKYRTLLYQKNDLGTLLKCSESVGEAIFFDFNIKNNKVMEPVSLPDVEKKLHSGPRLLKQAKLNHVMILGRAYVPQCDQWFYDHIEDYHKRHKEPDVDTSVSEYSDDE
nr:unnamed protein product [Callosobruchus chinensis]